MKKKILLISLFLILVSVFCFDHVSALVLDVTAPEINISTESKTCVEIVGKNLSKVIAAAINILKIAGAVIAIINAMIALVPAVMSKDADGLKKAQSKCISMAIILAVILVFPSILRFIGNALGLDVSCIF